MGRLALLRRVLPVVHSVPWPPAELGCCACMRAVAETVYRWPPGSSAAQLAAPSTGYPYSTAQVGGPADVDEPVLVYSARRGAPPPVAKHQRPPSLSLASLLASRKSAARRRSAAPGPAVDEWPAYSPRVVDALRSAPTHLARLGYVPPRLGATGGNLKENNAALRPIAAQDRPPTGAVADAAAAAKAAAVAAAAVAARTAADRLAQEMMMSCGAPVTPLPADGYTHLLAALLAAPQHGEQAAPPPAPPTGHWYFAYGALSRVGDGPGGPPGGVSPLSVGDALRVATTTAHMRAAGVTPTRGALFALAAAARRARSPALADDALAWLTATGAVPDEALTSALAAAAGVCPHPMSAVGRLLVAVLTPRDPPAPPPSSSTARSLLYALACGPASTGGVCDPVDAAARGDAIASLHAAWPSRDMPPHEAIAIAAAAVAATRAAGSPESTLALYDALMTGPAAEWWWWGAGKDHPAAGVDAARTERCARLREDAALDALVACRALGGRLTMATRIVAQLRDFGELRTGRPTEALIAACTSARDVDAAFDAHAAFVADGLRPHPHLYAGLIAAASSKRAYGRASQVIKAMAVSCTPADGAHLAGLLSLAAACGKHSLARLLAEHVSRPASCAGDAVSPDLTAWLGHAAGAVLSPLVGVPLTGRHYGHLMEAAGNSGAPGDVAAWWAAMRSSGTANTAKTSARALRAYGHCRDGDRAWALWTELQGEDDPAVMTPLVWAHAAAAVAKGGRARAAASIVDEATSRGMALPPIALVALPVGRIPGGAVSVAAATPGGDKAVGAVPSPLPPVAARAWLEAVRACRDKGDLTSALAVLEAHTHHPGEAARHYNERLAVCATAGMRSAARQLLDHMAGAGVPPNAATYGLLMQMAARAGDPTAAVAALASFTRSGHRPSVVHVTTLIAAYGAAGDAPRALAAYRLCAEFGLAPTSRTAEALIAATAGAKGGPDVARILMLAAWLGILDPGETPARLGRGRRATAATTPPPEPDPDPAPDLLSQLVAGKKPSAADEAACFGDVVGRAARCRVLAAPRTVESLIDALAQAERWDDAATVASRCGVFGPAPPAVAPAVCDLTRHGRSSTTARLATWAWLGRLRTRAEAATDAALAEAKAGAGGDVSAFAMRSARDKAAATWLLPDVDAVILTSRGGQHPTRARAVASLLQSRVGGPGALAGPGAVAPLPLRLVMDPDDGTERLVLPGKCLHAWLTTGSLSLDDPAALSRTKRKRRRRAANRPPAGISRWTDGDDGDNGGDEGADRAAGTGAARD